MRARLERRLYEGLEREHVGAVLLVQPVLHRVAQRVEPARRGGSVREARRVVAGAGNVFTRVGSAREARHVAWRAGGASLWLVVRCDENR